MHDFSTVLLRRMFYIENQGGYESGLWNSMNCYTMKKKKKKKKLSNHVLRLVAISW